MKEIFLAIGSNLKNPSQNVLKALQEIQKIKNIFDFKASNLYHTSPVSDIPQPDYINAACYFKTEIPPLKLFEQLSDIEKKLGKIKKNKNEPRIIDIDLLLYGTTLSDNPKLLLPHPEMLNRCFVLRPLCDLVDVIEYPIAKNQTKKISLKNTLLRVEKSSKESVRKKIFEKSLQ